jgi:hypothetical protein
MPHEKDNLQKAISNGNVQKTKELLESGATVLEQYSSKNADSLLLLITKPKGVGRGIFAKKHDKQLAQLDKKTADSMATMLAQVNNFDAALYEAVNKGFLQKEIIEIDEKKEQIIKKSEPTDMLKGRYKLAALVLNHYASNDENRIDLLSRFSSLKESVPENHAKKEEWNQTYNLINKHIELGKKSSPAKRTDTQEQGTENNFPVTSITIIDPKDDISLTYSTESSISFEARFAKDTNRQADKAASVITELAVVVGESSKYLPKKPILRRSESSSSQER